MCKFFCPSVFMMSHKLIFTKKTFPAIDSSSRCPIDQGGHCWAVYALSHSADSYSLLPSIHRPQPRATISYLNSGCRQDVLIGQFVGSVGCNVTWGNLPPLSLMCNMGGVTCNRYRQAHKVISCEVGQRGVCYT